MDAMMTPIDMPLEDVIKMKKEENKEKKNKLMIVVKKEIQDKGQEDKAEDENKIRPKTPEIEPHGFNG